MAGAPPWSREVHRLPRSSVLLVRSCRQGRRGGSQPPQPLLILLVPTLPIGSGAWEVDGAWLPCKRKFKTMSTSKSQLSPSSPETDPLNTHTQVKRKNFHFRFSCGSEDASYRGAHPSGCVGAAHPERRFLLCAADPRRTRFAQYSDLSVDAVGAQAEVGVCDSVSPRSLCVRRYSVQTTRGRAQTLSLWQGRYRAGIPKCCFSQVSASQGARPLAVGLCSAAR